MEEGSQRVVVGMDPHKRSVTVEVMAADEKVLGSGRFATDVAGYRSMLEYLKRWPDRVWAIEGCNGIGRHIAMRLLADGLARKSSTYRRSSRHEPGSSQPAKVGRPTPPTPTPWPWSEPG